MGSHTFEAGTMPSGTPVTLTVEGLPRDTAALIGAYARNLTRQIRVTAYEREAARKAAHRLAERQKEQTKVTYTEDQRLTLARKGELSSRPVTAEIAIGYPLAGGGATLRLYSAAGNQVDSESLTDRPRYLREPDPESWHEDKITDGAMTEGLLTAAGWHLARKGFNYARGASWRPYAGRDGEKAQRKEWEFASSDYSTDGSAPYLARVALVPTADYLAYVEASYGPAPVLEELAELPEGWKVRRVQRGWWEITADGRRCAITFQPMIGREAWRVRNEDHPDDDSPRFHSSHDDAPAAVAALVEHLSK